AADLFEKGTELDFGRNLRNDFQYFKLLLPVALRFFCRAPAFQSDGGLPDKRLEQFTIIFSKLAVDLVEEFRNANRPATQRSKRNTKNAAGDVTRLFIDLRVETVIGVG